MVMTVVITSILPRVDTYFVPIMYQIFYMSSPLEVALFYKWKT